MVRDFGCEVVYAQKRIKQSRFGVAAITIRLLQESSKFVAFSLQRDVSLGKLTDSTTEMTVLDLQLSNVDRVFSPDVVQLRRVLGLDVDGVALFRRCPRIARAEVPDLIAHLTQPMLEVDLELRKCGRGTFEAQTVLGVVQPRRETFAICPQLLTSRHQFEHLSIRATDPAAAETVVDELWYSTTTDDHQ